MQMDISIPFEEYRRVGQLVGEGKWDDKKFNDVFRSILAMGAKELNEADEDTVDEFIFPYYKRSRLGRARLYFSVPNSVVASLVELAESKGLDHLPLPVFVRGLILHMLRKDNLESVVRRAVYDSSASRYNTLDSKLEAMRHEIRRARADRDISNSPEPEPDRELEWWEQ